MGKQYRAVIEENTFNNVFKLSGIPKGKTSFDTALNLILRNVMVQKTARNEGELKQNFSREIDTI